MTGLILCYFVEAVFSGYLMRLAMLETARLEG